MNANPFVIARMLVPQHSSANYVLSEMHVTPVQNAVNGKNDRTSSVLSEEGTLALLIPHIELPTDKPCFINTDNTNRLTRVTVRKGPPRMR